MRRHLLAAAVLGLFGTLLVADDAMACHRRNNCNTGCAPVATCAPRKHCFGGGGHHARRGCGHHRRQATCGTCGGGSVGGGYAYAAPATYAAPQAIGAPQAAPAKQTPH